MQMSSWTRVGGLALMQGALIFSLTMDPAGRFGRLGWASVVLGAADLAAICVRGCARLLQVRSLLVLQGLR